MKKSNYKLKDIFSLLLEIIVQILYTVFFILEKFLTFIIKGLFKIIKDILSKVYGNIIKAIAATIAISILTFLSVYL